MCLEGAWGRIRVRFGTPAPPAWLLDVGVGAPVALALDEEGYVASEFGASGAGLIARAALADHLVGRGGVVLHASAIVESGAATLFLGRSGAGKTTISTQAEGALLGDDTVVVWPELDELCVVATPFVSEGGRPAEVQRGRPTAVCTLAWGAERQILRLEPKATFDALIQSVYAPPGAALPSSVVATTLALADAVVGYRLTYPKDYRFRARDLADAT